MNFLVTKVNNPIEHLSRVGVDPASVVIFKNKGEFVSLLIYDVPVIAANVIKQEMLAAGGDAAVHRQAITHRVDRTHVLTMGTLAQHRKLIEKLSMMHYWELDKIAKDIEDCLFGEVIRCMNLPSGRKLYFDRTLIMGVINVTPDSFYAASRVEKDKLLDRVAQMIREGVDIIDIGGESTRPGSDRVTEEEEMSRVVPAVELVKKNFDVVVSVDTYKAKVAEESIKVGAEIVNDVSALRFDPNMVEVLKKYKPAVVLMHMKGEPKTMQENPHYDDVVKEILYFLKERIEFLSESGIDDRIMIDPGIGFGKRLEDNLEIIKRISEFKSLKRPVLIGASRKSFIGKVLGDVPPEERLYGTLAVTAYCVLNGVDVIRVHDVRENSHVIKLIETIRKTDNRSF
ncbi:dihydropteroate synthase [Pseudothermotoga sp.]|nr:dihydropteroate synthase [Pseudothermotoga sp.]MCX7813651.1 dihydropteroate synthase [Pseudothermotoga sp.]MDW8139502.1 dihydropteroate synthase [Pseudothermotoga sp.]